MKNLEYLYRYIYILVLCGLERMDNNYNVLQLVVVLNILLLTPQRIVYYGSIITGSLLSITLMQNMAY